MLFQILVHMYRHISEHIYVAVTFWTYIKNVLDSILDRDIGYYELFRGFLSPSIEILG